MSKILILYTKIGGGHKSTAQSFYSQLNTSLGSSVAIEMLDMFEANDKKQSKNQLINIGKILEDNYTLSTTRLPFLWAFLVILLKLNWFARFCYWLFETYFSHNIDTAIARFEPDIVICTYYGGAEYVSKKYGIKNNIKTFTVVPDLFSPHQAWFRPDTANNYLVFSDQAKQIATNMNIQNVTNLGLCFDSKFEQKMNDEQILEFKKLNAIDPNQKLILAIGGGSGFPKAKKLLQEYLKSDIRLNAQLVIVCGRDQKLKLELENLLSKNSNSNIQILGFSKQIYEWINCADVVISKSGPATILEMVALQKPLFLIHYIWEQELGNMRWVVDNNLGIYEPNPTIMISKIKEYLEEKTAVKTKFQTINLQNNLSKITDVIYPNSSLTSLY